MSEKMSTLELERISEAWNSLPALRVPRNEAEHAALVRWLDQLVDLVGNDEAHPLASLMDVIGTLIESYEDATLPDFTT